MNENNEIYYSTVSVWEVTIKHILLIRLKYVMTRFWQNMNIEKSALRSISL